MQNRTTRRTERATPEQLKDLRSLRVVVLLPQDGDGRQLTQQIQRIGCHVQAFWPPPAELPEATDVVFLAVNADSIQMTFDWLHNDAPATMIAVTAYENPTLVQAVLHVGAKAVLPSPIRSFGVLSTLVVARRVHDDARAQARRVAKLEAKLLGARRIAEAKTILIRNHRIDENRAYDLIREQAMAKRCTTEEIAAAIINANDILSFQKQ